MKAEYVELPPDLVGKADPDEAWIERELDRIDPWRHEQGADAATTRAMRKLVQELRQQLETPQPETGGPAFPALEIRTADTGDLVANASQGITVRDYFAIRAFQTRLAKYNDWTLDELTEQAYLDADAMLKARDA